MNTIIAVMAVVTISFWAYCNVFYKRNLLKYPVGYLVFALIQWLLVLINSIWIWGWLIGAIVFLILMLGGAILITNFITNQLFRLLKMSPDIALALFGIFVWLFGISTVIKIFI